MSTITQCTECGRTAVDEPYETDPETGERTEHEPVPLCVQCLFQADPEIGLWYREMVELAYLEGTIDGAKGMADRIRSELPTVDRLTK